MSPAVAQEPSDLTTEQLDERVLTEAAANIVDVMSGGDQSWRERVSFPDCVGSTFLDSADWQMAVTYARAALIAMARGKAEAEADMRRWRDRATAECRAIPNLIASVSTRWTSFANAAVAAVERLRKTWDENRQWPETPGQAVYAIIDALRALSSAPEPIIDKSIHLPGATSADPDASSPSSCMRNDH